VSFTRFLCLLFRLLLSLSFFSHLFHISISSLSQNIFTWYFSLSYCISFSREAWGEEWGLSEGLSENREVMFSSSLLIQHFPSLLFYCRFFLYVFYISSWGQLSASIRIFSVVAFLSAWLLFHFYFLLSVIGFLFLSLIFSLIESAFSELLWLAFLLRPRWLQPQGDFSAFFLRFLSHFLSYFFIFWFSSLFSLHRALIEYFLFSSSPFSLLLLLSLGSAASWEYFSRRTAYNVFTSVRHFQRLWASRSEGCTLIYFWQSF